tara:strand:+ start:266 stop:1111 length:846 start_codon:yes stop_codon:yes gene_type:complete
MKILFVADLFVEDGINGGGELNNEELIKILLERGHEVYKAHSSRLDINAMPPKEYKIILGNFLGLEFKVAKEIINNYSYIIYEHDHKYLKTRDPSPFKNFKAPQNMLVNQDLYKNAKAILCQSKLHKEVIEKNLLLSNIINLSGNLWSEETLKHVEDIATSQEEKSDKCSIMYSNFPNKNVEGSIKYCKIKELEYDKIMPCGHQEFLDKLNKNKSLVFFPKTLETLSRIVIEARMMNCRVITNKMIGATSEEWFKLKGKDLIKEMRNRRESIPNKVLEIFE